jgi:hypothetical protein
MQSYIERDSLNRLGYYLRAARHGDIATCDHGAAVFGFLVQRGEKLSAQVFADRISRHYDMTNPRTAAIVRALQLCE